MCIANNNVPPAVSRRISLQVHFKPSVWVPSQLVGAPLGTDVTIECVIEAFPKAITYWQKSQDGKEKIILNGPEQTEDRIGYRTSSKLIIRQFSSGDVGTYQCVSSNSLGSDQEVIRIYENPQVTEPAWFTKSSSSEFTTQSSWTRTKKITPNPHYRNTYKYVEYHQRTPAPGHATVTERSDADVRTFFSSAPRQCFSGTYQYLLLAPLLLTK